VFIRINNYKQTAKKKKEKKKEKKQTKDKNEMLVGHVFFINYDLACISLAGINTTHILILQGDWSMESKKVPAWDLETPQ